MLKLVSSMKEVNIEQYLAVYRQPEWDSRVEDQMLSYLQEEFFTIRGAVCALWVADGRYVSALRLEPYKDGYLITAVETALQERRKGYAKALLQAVINRFGGPVYSHIEKSNRPSLNLHNACGFAVCSDFAVLLDGTVTNRYCTVAYNK